MAGAVGGGGLGDFAIRYGYQQLRDRHHRCSPSSCCSSSSRPCSGPAIAGRAGSRARPDTPPRPVAVRPPAPPEGELIDHALPLAPLLLAAIRGDRPAHRVRRRLRPSSSAADKPLAVGASPVPHAEILNYVKDNLAADAGPRPGGRGVHRLRAAEHRPGRRLARRQLLPDHAVPGRLQRDSTAPLRAAGRRCTWSRWASTPSKSTDLADLKPARPSPSPTTPTNAAARCSCSPPTA